MTYLACNIEETALKTTLREELINNCLFMVMQKIVANRERTGSHSLD